MNDRILSRHPLQERGEDDVPAMDLRSSTLPADIHLEPNPMPFLPTSLDTMYGLYPQVALPWNTGIAGQMAYPLPIAGEVFGFNFGSYQPSVSLIYPSGLYTQSPCLPLAPDPQQQGIVELELQVHLLRLQLTQQQQHMQIMQQLLQQGQPFQYAQQTIECQPPPPLFLQQQQTLYQPFNSAYSDNGQQQLVQSLLQESWQLVENWCLCDQCQIFKEQRLKDLLFSPKISCSSLPETSPSSTQLEFNNGQDVHEDSSSNIQSLVPTTPKQNREEESEIGGGTNRNANSIANSNAKAKRTRKPLQLQKRLEIIAFWEANQKLSKAEISRMLNIPRSTVYGILENKDALKELTKRRPTAGLNMERFRTYGPRYRFLEEFLVIWSLDLASRGVVISDMKVTAQAFEIQRMLSGLVVEPLPPCAFTTGWLKRFKRRQKISLGASKNVCNSTIQDESWLFVEEHLRHFSGSLDDIYMCGNTNMSPDMHPSQVYNDTFQESSASKMQSLDATVFLCCNASGSDKRPPVILVGYSSENSTSSFSGINVTDSDLYDRALSNWLCELDRAVDRPILLIMDLKRDHKSQQQLQSSPVSVSRHLQSLLTRLNNITLVEAPTFATPLPLALGLAKEFKQIYYRYYLEECAKNAYPGVHSTVLQYYSAQDNDIGPWILLRNKMHWMKHHDDFKSCFGSNALDRGTLIDVIMP
ncbi:hypothetical protein BGZ65_004706 [Modicella reniformis]|uniref:HTH CENPB-type domain-containing protein n=1 Tax=Modicella reniformis TaxID=1440133 RepID=A0A9P6LT80_9FUNG|nr:hypothetical protein BGZ65_004706 [Modicella reniformis]